MRTLKIRAGIIRAFTLLCSLLSTSIGRSASAAPFHQRAYFIRAAEALTLHREGAHFLDARELPLSPVFGRVSGARSARWRDFSKGAKDGELLPFSVLLEKLSTLGLSGERPVVIYGDWTQGWGEEGRLFWMLDYLSYPTLYVLEGGWQAWRAAGGDIERGMERSTSPGRWRPAPRPMLRQRLEDYQGDQNPLQPLDTRSRAEFEGATPYGSPCGGHIPNAVSLPWTSFFEGDRLLSEAALRQLFQEAGLDLSRPIAAYCTGGIRSGFAYLVLRSLGVKQVRNGDGSWWRWSRARCAERD